MRELPNSRDRVCERAEDRFELIGGLRGGFGSDSASRDVQEMTAIQRAGIDQDGLGFENQRERFPGIAWNTGLVSEIIRGSHWKNAEWSRSTHEAFQYGVHRSIPTCRNHRITPGGCALARVNRATLACCRNTQLDRHAVTGREVDEILDLVFVRAILVNDQPVSLRSIQGLPHET